MFFKHGAGIQILHTNGFPFRINRGDFVAHPHVNAEARTKTLWRLQR